MTPEVLLRKLTYLRQLLSDIDYRILHASIALALRDFGQFVAVFEARLDNAGMS